MYVMDDALGRPLDDAHRLKAITGAQLHGHLGDTDLDAVVATLGIACAVQMAVVNIVTSDRQTYIAEIGIESPFTTIEDKLSFCARVALTGRSLVVTDAASHKTYSANPLVQSGDVGAYAGEPLIDSRHVVGSVAIFDRHSRIFSAGELEVLRYQARLASAVLALRRAARADPLTGLPNRALLMDRLSHALARSQRSGNRVGVFFLDIDGFKAINDRLGHAAGDRYLVELAERLTSAIRSGDTLGRLGGDEFVIVCEDLTSEDSAVTLAEHLLTAVGTKPTAESHDFPMEISIGIALAPDLPIEPAALLAGADKAMYKAKQKMGSSWELASDSESRSRIHSSPTQGDPFTRPSLVRPSECIKISPPHVASATRCLRRVGEQRRSSRAGEV